MKLKNITIGADPELFLINKKTGKVISSIGIIPGEKGNAYQGDMPDGFGLQIDNILAEFNIPVTTLGEKNRFVSDIMYAKEYIRNYISKINPNYDILCQASAEVPEKELKSDEAKQFGCSVDYNAYTMDANPRPEGDTTNLRTTGCHIHIGYENPNARTSIEIVKYLDACLGVASVLIDTDTERRKLYGKAGCFRLTAYGVEYRVLSGFFISSPEVIYMMYDLMAYSLSKFNNGSPIPPNKIIEDIINNNNTELARLVLKKYFFGSNTVKQILGAETTDSDVEFDNVDRRLKHTIQDILGAGYEPFLGVQGRF